MFGEVKYWLLLFVASVILPSSLYWMDIIARVIQTFNRFVCVYVCACTHTTMPQHVTTPAVASYYFVCHVPMPQPSFCHS